MRQTLFLLLFLVTFLHHSSFGQSADSSRKTGFFSGSVSVTNNGISVIPTFSLGKPATIITLSTGKNRFSFDPELRFSLEAKPWSFIFWWRYKLVRSPKFLLNIGVHPALNFKSELLSINGVYRETMVSRRYFAAEMAPSYQVGKNIRLGMYYLHSRGLDHGTTGITHFITLNSQFSAIRLSKEYFIRFTPQVHTTGLLFTNGSAGWILCYRSTHIGKKRFPDLCFQYVQQKHTDQYYYQQGFCLERKSCLLFP